MIRRALELSAVAVAAGALVGGVQAAAGEGGYSIATAPEVVLGEAEFGAPVSGARYWRIRLRFGDELTLELRNRALWDLDRPIRYCLLPPSVTDVNLARSACAAERTVRRGESSRLRFSARSGGGWTLGAVSNSCSTFQRCATVGDTFSFVYEFTAGVRRFTRTTLRGPGVVRPGARVAFTGAVSGAAGGAVEIRAAGGRTVVVRLTGHGRFAWSSRAPSAPGTYRVRADFRGDAGHLASGALVSYRVAG